MLTSACQDAEYLSAGSVELAVTPANGVDDRALIDRYVESGDFDAIAEGPRAELAHHEQADPGRSSSLHAAIESLPSRQRACLRLYYWLGCSTNEVATSLGLPSGTVESDLYRARRGLARYLQRHGVTDV